MQDGANSSDNFSIRQLFSDDINHKKSKLISILHHINIICYCYAAVCGRASGPQVSAPLGTAGNGWICCTDDHRSCLAGMQIIHIYLNAMVLMFRVTNHSNSHPCGPKVYNIFDLMALLPISLTGKIRLDVLHEHRSNLCIRGLLWDWTGPNPMVYCGWTVQSRTKTLCICCCWILQLDSELYRGHVLPICWGKRPVRIISRK